MRKFSLQKSAKSAGKPGTKGFKSDTPSRVSKDEAVLLRGMRDATEVNERTGLPDKVTVVQAARKANDANPGDNIPVVVNKREFDAMCQHFGQPREHPETGVMQFGYGGADQGRSINNDKGGGMGGGRNGGNAAGGGGASGTGAGHYSDAGYANRKETGYKAGMDGFSGNAGAGGMGDSGVKIDRVQKGLPGDPANIEGNWNEWAGPQVDGQKYGDIEFRDNEGNVVDTPTTKIPTPLPMQALLTAAGLIGPPGFGIGMRIGDWMGTQVGEDQAAIDAGRKKSTRMDDPSMGRVDDVAGQGIGSYGNAASDDRAENVNGLGGGMTGGGGGGGDGKDRSLKNATDARISTLIKNGVITPDNIDVFGIPLSRYNQIANQIYPSTPSPASAAADAAQNKQPYSPLNITGSSSVTTWPWTNGY